ncbi:MAG: YggT family protein [Halothiobacillaceae bacterium]|jgi:YggT family protein|nr:YggT family protein [Halothiobacillaceae bacterium]MDY0049651.1 YggT family protein [Halothiobacillaceae bacterium]
MNATDPFVFLVYALFQLYLFIVLLRYVLQLFRASFFNPVSQLVVRATDPLLRPLRRLLPAMGRHDIAALVLAFVLNLLMWLIIAAIQGVSPSVGALLVKSVASLLTQAIDLFFWAVLIRAILSWVASGNRNPAVALIEEITDPLLAPVQKILPPLGGIDLSPLAVLLALQFVSIAIQAWVLPALIGVL